MPSALIWCAVVVLHPSKRTRWEAALATLWTWNRGGCAAYVYPEAIQACSLARSALVGLQTLGSQGVVMSGWWVVEAVVRASQVMNVDATLFRGAS